MPIPSDVIHECNVYLQEYVRFKITGKDIAEKQKEILRIQGSLTNASLKRFPDADWIPILLDIGKVADDTQAKGTYCSKFSETLYMVLHRIRRELNSVVLQSEVKKVQEDLNSLKLKYINAKKDNQTEGSLNAIQGDIETRIRRLVYLGELDALVDLDLDEMRLIHKPPVLQSLSMFWGGKPEEFGFEYSKATTNHSVNDINTYLPLVVQHGGEKLTFERIYLAKYFHEKRPEPREDLSALETLPETPSSGKLSAHSPEHKAVEKKIDEVKLHLKPLKLAEPPYEFKKSEKKESVSPDFVLELANDLDNYTLGKTHGFDLDLKIKECNDIKVKLNDLSQKHATVDEWMDLVMYIGEQADRIQKNGRFCSGCSEVFYYVLHKLRLEIEKNAPAAFTAKLEKEKKIFAELHENARATKLKSENEESIKTAEEKVNQARCRLAYLGFLDPLLSIKQAKLEQKQMYYGTYNDMFGGSFLEWFTGTPIVGFEYSRIPKPYGLVEPVTIYLPLVLQREFTKIYLKKYESKLKAAADTKNANEQGAKAVKTLESEITKLSNSLLVRKLLEHQNKEDEKAFTAVDLTVENVDVNITEKLKEIELHIATTRKFLNQATGAKKDELNGSLTKFNQEIAPIQEALTKVLKVFRKAQLEKDRLREEAESKAEREAHAAISEFGKRVDDFASVKEFLLIETSKDKDINALEESKLTHKGAEAVLSAIKAFEADKQKIEMLISNSSAANQSELKQKLQSHLIILLKFEAAATKVLATLKAAQVENEMMIKLNEKLPLLKEHIESVCGEEEKLQSPDKNAALQLSNRLLEKIIQTEKDILELGKLIDKLTLKQSEAKSALAALVDPFVSFKARIVKANENLKIEKIRQDLASLTGSIQSLISSTEHLIANADSDVNDLAEARLTEEELERIRNSLVHAEENAVSLKSRIGTLSPDKQGAIDTAELQIALPSIAPILVAVNKMIATLKAAKASKAQALAVEVKGTTHGTVLAFMQKKGLSPTPSPEDSPNISPFPSAATISDSGPDDQLSLDGELEGKAAAPFKPLMGLDARKELFRKVAELRGVKPQKIDSKIESYERRYQQDKSIIQEFLIELQKANKEPQSQASFALS